MSNEISLPDLALKWFDWQNPECVGSKLEATTSQDLSPPPTFKKHVNGTIDLTSATLLIGPNTSLLPTAMIVRLKNPDGGIYRSTSLIIYNIVPSDTEIIAIKSEACKKICDDQTLSIPKNSKTYELITTYLNINQNEGDSITSFPNALKKLPDSCYPYCPSYTLTYRNDNTFPTWDNTLPTWATFDS